jgi:hypothetical protein
VEFSTHEFLYNLPTPWAIHLPNVGLTFGELQLERRIHVFLSFLNLVEVLGHRHRPFLLVSSLVGSLQLIMDVVAVPSFFLLI